MHSCCDSNPRMLISGSKCPTGQYNSFHTTIPPRLNSCRIAPHTSDRASVIEGGGKNVHAVVVQEEKNGGGKKKV